LGGEYKTKESMVDTKGRMKKKVRVVFQGMRESWPRTGEERDYFSLPTRGDRGC